jgi:hypothetical protein
MAFATYENSPDKGEPVQLYLFRYGAEPDHIFAYTNAEAPVEMIFLGQAITFQPVSIESGEITSDGSLDNKKLTIVFPDHLELYALFRDRPPSTVVTCIIWNGHINDPDEQFVVEWSGRVIGFADEGNEVELTCDPVSSMMLRNALRRHWQYGCMHALYSQGDGMCNASRAAATAPFITGTVSGSTVTIDVAASVLAYGASTKYTDFANADKRAYYVGGIFEMVDGDGHKTLRRIVRLVGTTQILLSAPVPDLVAGQSVNLIFGCNHKTGIASLNDGGHCGPVHNNIRNFGGQPWIPLTNPIGLRNIYR